MKMSNCNKDYCEIDFSDHPDDIGDDIKKISETGMMPKPIGRPTKDQYYIGIALAVSKRSTCLKRHYGCVIVKNDEIIATGYNGNPRGQLNCCDRGFCTRLNVPHNSGDYSHCFSVHAEQNAMLSAQRKDMIGATMYLAGEEYKLDVNASAIAGEDIYSYIKVDEVEPCPVCSRMIKNAGIVRIVGTVD